MRTTRHSIPVMAIDVRRAMRALPIVIPAKAGIQFSIQLPASAGMTNFPSPSTGEDRGEGDFAFTQ